MLREFWPYIAVLFILAVIKISHAVYWQLRLKEAGIAEIDKMGGKEFVQYLELLFERLGYSVYGDLGGDLVLDKNDVKTVVQAARRHKKNVGSKAVREVVAAKAYYEAQAAMIVTNSDFTSAAVKLAKVNNVELWDRNRLVQAILKTKKKTNKLPK